MTHDAYNKQVYYTQNVWNPIMLNCPSHIIVSLLDEYSNEYIGTVYRDSNKMYRGECYKGDPDMFYRMKIVAWKSLTPNDLR